MHALSLDFGGVRKAIGARDSDASGLTHVLVSEGAASSWAGLALEQLLEQLPAAQATALRLTVLEGFSLRQAASRLEISCMSVQRAQKKAIAALRQQLAGGG